MPRLKSILCPIDFSEFSVKAYDYAQSLAWHYKAELLVQYVRYSFPAFYIDASYKEIRRKLRADALQKLREFVKRQTRTKVQPQCVVHEGCKLSESSIYSDRILSFAEAQAVDLIVMGTHGLSGVDRLMLGSVTEKVLRKARCPVLVVRKPAHDFVSPGEKADPINMKRDCSVHGFLQARSACFESRIFHRKAVQRRAHFTPRVGTSTRLGGHSKRDNQGDGAAQGIGSTTSAQAFPRQFLGADRQALPADR